MASPHVAGLVACLLTNGQTTASIRQRLNELAIDIDAEGVDNATGVGFPTYLDRDSFDQMFRVGDAKASVY
jgi:hypothetical protein